MRGQNSINHQASRIANAMSRTWAPRDLFKRVKDAMRTMLADGRLRRDEIASIGAVEFWERFDRDP